MKNNASSSKDIYLRLLGYVKPYWRIFALAILGMIAGGLTEAGIPVLLKPLLDESFVYKNAEAINATIIFLVLLFIARGLANFVAQVAISWVGLKVVYDLRCAMFNQLLVTPAVFYNQNSSGSLISKITYNTTQVSAAITSVLIVLIKDSITVIALLAWMFYLDWQLSLIFLIVGPIIGYIVKIISTRLRQISRSIQSSMGDLTATLSEATTGAEVVKIFGGEDYEKTRFQTVANWVRRYEMKSITVIAANVPIVQVIGAVAFACVIYIVSIKAESDQMTVGTFVSFFGAMAMLFSPIKRLTKLNEQIQRGLAAAETIFALIDEPSEPDHGTRALSKAKGKLQFKDVSFKYPEAEQDTLHKINLTINAGETVAFVGPSGSGKSTLASLIPRFHLPSEGQILIDDIPAEDIKLKDLRGNIALVSQRLVLFNDTVEANIAYGCNSHASKEDIVEAARAAHALEFIEKLPQGFNTLVGENGARLSGGQRQRIAIARALLKDASLLIMDEATSALDMQSELYVQQALETLRKNRTAIIIAHRLSTIENADRIVVLEKGRIVEIGNHAELLAKGGLYAHLSRTSVD